jgi:predicted ATP-binding protein involved in virulence
MITSFQAEQLSIGFDFNIELEKNKQIYCFIGKNSIGKTLLLENMAKSLIFCHSMFEIEKSNKLKYSGFFSIKNISDNFNTFTLKLPLDININNIKIKDKNKESWGVVTFEFLHLTKNNSFIYDSPVIFIGAKNRGFTKNIDTNNIKILADKDNRFIESFQRTWKYINGEGLEQEEIADWFTSRLIINPHFITTNQNKIFEAETVLKLIDRLEPNLNLVQKNEKGEISLKISFSEGKLLINNIPLDKLSTGYVSIIKIFQEIVAGYSGWTDAENLNEVEGIVFIDELEPHLHISWQTKIISILREFFPKTTFYISTHSPLVLAGLKNGEGYELIKENNVVKAKPIDNIENYFLNDIVKEFFDVDLNKEKIQNVNQERQQKGKKILLNLLQNLKEDK